MTVQSCSFTGHRQIEPQHLKKLPELLSRGIEYLYGEGVRTFYSGGAIGFDTVCAFEVIRFRQLHPDVRLILILPCQEQSERWTPQQKEKYSYILRCANEIIYTSDSYTPYCMRKRNRELVARADVMIAYLSHRNSGSGMTARMAEEKGIKVYNLYRELDKS